jgi:sarcosine oxidase
VRRAYELWAELERVSGRKLLHQTGGLMIGLPQGALVDGARRSAEKHQLPYEWLSAGEVTRRFPALRPDSDMMALWEPRAGFLFPEFCIWAHLDAARMHQAELRWEETVVRWEAKGQGVLVVSNRDQYCADRLILTAGPWIGTLVPELRDYFTIERQVQFWFDPNQSDLFSIAHCPIHIWEHATGKFFYGFPDLGAGVKVAGHHEGAVVGPDSVDRNVKPHEIEGMRQLVRRYLPAADGLLRRTAVCAYTNTPDCHFLIDEHPAHSRVLIVSPCSGHGFKFSAAIGEILCAWVQQREPGFN